MRFFADEMLGKLARWLRMAGFDVLYQNKTEDNDLIEIAGREDRIILTRDTHLIKRIKGKEFLFISHDDLEDQAQEVFNNFPGLLKEKNPLSRCAECNTELQTVEKETIKDKVWPYVYQTQESFTTCPTCHRIYWKATHVKKIEEKIRKLLNLPK